MELKDIYKYYVMNASHNIDDKIIYTDGNDIIRIIDNFFSEDVLKKIVDYFFTIL